MANLITIHRYDEEQAGKITPSVVEKRLQLIRNRALKTQTHDNNSSQSSKPSPSQKLNSKLKHNTPNIQSDTQKKHNHSINTQDENKRSLKKRKHDTSDIQAQNRKSKKKAKHDTSNSQPEDHITSKAQHQPKSSKMSKKLVKVSINQATNQQSNQNLRHPPHAQLIQPVDPIVENDNVDSGNDETIDQANNHDHPENDQAQNSQYIILGKKTSSKTAKSVPENFPEWIAKPNYINSQNKMEIEEVSYLQKFMLKKLRNQGISHLFPGSLIYVNISVPITMCNIIYYIQDIAE